MAEHARAGADLDVWISPPDPHHVDNLTYRWRFDKSGFSGMAMVQILTLAAGPAGCPETAAQAEAARYRQAGGPGGLWFAEPVDTNQTEPSGEAYRTNLLRLPPGGYVVCGYMYDFDKNPETPYGSFRQWGGHPDVGPVAHPFTVREPRATVDLAVAPRTMRQASDERITFTSRWSAEPTYSGPDAAESDPRGEWGFGVDPELGVAVLPDTGATACPQKPPRLELDTFLPLDRGLIGEARNEPWTAEGASSVTRPLFVPSDHPDLDGSNWHASGAQYPPGRYLLCAYVYRYWDVEGEAPTFFSEARSLPVPFEVTASPAAGGQGCVTAKTKLRRAKTRLRRARRLDAPRAKLRKRRATVRRARAGVRAAC